MFSSKRKYNIKMVTWCWKNVILVGFKSYNNKVAYTDESKLFGLSISPNSLNNKIYIFDGYDADG